MQRTALLFLRTSSVNYRPVGARRTKLKEQILRKPRTLKGTVK